MEKCTRSDRNLAGPGLDRPGQLIKHTKAARKPQQVVHQLKPKKIGLHHAHVLLGEGLGDLMPCDESDDVMYQVGKQKGGNRL